MAANACSASAIAKGVTFAHIIFVLGGHRGRLPAKVPVGIFMWERDQIFSKPRPDADLKHVAKHCNAKLSQEKSNKRRGRGVGNNSDKDSLINRVPALPETCGELGGLENGERSDGR